MAADGKKGITVKVDEQLHAEVTQYLQSHGMKMAEFVAMALQDELHPKNDMKEGKTMGNMRTLAFQVPEDLFQRIKDYLHRNNMTQKEFVIGLIERELEQDLARHQDTGEALDASEDVGLDEGEHSNTWPEATEGAEEALSPDTPDEDILPEEGSQTADQEDGSEEASEDDLEALDEEASEDIQEDADAEGLDDLQEDDGEDETEDESEDEDESLGMTMGM